MRLTKQRLRVIIKEELSVVIRDQDLIVESAAMQDFSELTSNAQAFFKQQLSSITRSGNKRLQSFLSLMELSGLDPADFLEAVRQPSDLKALNMNDITNGRLWVQKQSRIKPWVEELVPFFMKHPGLISK